MNTTLSTETISHFANTLRPTLSIPQTMHSRMPRMRRRVPHTISADAVFVDDCWVLNTAVATQIEAHVRLVNRSARPMHGQLKFEIADASNQRVIISTTITFNVEVGRSLSITRTLSATEAAVWTFEHQNTYQLIVSLETRRISQSVPQRRLEFGFLEFAVEGVGRDEMFRLRNRKARLSAVIPWSCWASNGLAPVAGAKGSSNM